MESVGDHDQTSFEATNVRQNNQSFDLQYNHDYKLKVEGSWNQTPHDYSNIGQTLYNEASPGVFRLPDQHALHLGQVYGNGRAERMLKRVFDKLGLKSTDFIVATKIGHFPGTSSAHTSVSTF